MCNELHDKYCEIPESGEAYKLFREYGTGLCYADYVNVNQDGMFEWRSFTSQLFPEPKNRYTGKYGFCMFMTKEEALCAEYRWHHETGDNDIIVKKIVYSGGLGEFDEYEMFGEGVKPVQAALCKAWKFAEENENV